MVPDRVGWELLGLLLAEDFSVMPITSGDLRVVSGLFWEMEHNPAYEVPVVSDGSGAVDPPGEELCSFRVWTSEDDWKVGVVDPSTFPVYFRLDCCEPWVAEDGFVFSEVRKEELEWDGGRSGTDIQDSVVAKVSASVFGTIDVKEFAGFWELFDGEF